MNTSINEDISEDMLLKMAAGMEYRPLTAEDAMRLKPFYSIRPNKSCDAAPLCQYIYRYFYRVKFCEFEDALLIMFCSDDGEIYGFLPYCRPEKVAFYFKLQEIYFNKVLKMPFAITSADEEGVELLKEAGALDGYDIEEIEDAKDYLYDAESLRTLAGRKYSKKRNHINKFNQIYDGRWEYRKLTYEDRCEVLAFLRLWMDKKVSMGESEGVNESGDEFDPMVELEAEFKGIQDVVNDKRLYDHIRIGGIFIDGRLEAFSMGDYNEAEKLAIIDVEKANEEIPGLYQVINQQFALSEYPEAELINREDDVGIEGLRKSKMSYYPSGFERKYLIRQRDLRSC